MIAHKNLQLINAATVAMLVAAAAVVMLGWTTDRHGIETVESNITSSPPANRLRLAGQHEAADSVSTAPLASSEIWSRPLQAGFKTPTVASVPAATPMPVIPLPAAVAPLDKTTADLGLRLVGTVVENGKSMAIVIDRQGKLDFRRVGDALLLEPRGIRIDAVAVDSVQVSYKDKSMSWLLGQSLVLDVPNPSLPTEVPAPTEAPAKPKLSLEAELDSLNGNTSTDPF